MHPYLKATLKTLLAIATLVGVKFFCDFQTKGFRPHLIVSNLPNDPRWEVPELTEEEQQQVDTLLDQKFTFLGTGGWCYAFLGEDQTTVLKFYKHSHLLPSTIFREGITFDKLLFKSAPWPQNAPYFQEFNFKSCMLLYKEAKERTGLLYVHINKTENKHKPVILIDNVGVQHPIDLDKTEFIVQRKAQLLIPHLQQLMHDKKPEEAKRCIDNLLQCLLTFYQKGIRDYDKSIRKNFGFIGEYAISLDISSFGPDPSLKDPEEYRKEIALKTHRVARWLRKHEPELYIHYEKSLKNLSQ